MNGEYQSALEPDRVIGEEDQYGKMALARRSQPGMWGKRTVGPHEIKKERLLRYILKKVIWKDSSTTKLQEIAEIIRSLSEKERKG